MEYIIVGLGNPGSEYLNTRHNVGRLIVSALQERLGTSDWRNDKRLHAKISQGSIDKDIQIVLVLPDNYMNRSGASIAPLVKNVMQLERLIVVHDDIDIPFGHIRIAKARGSGGHQGVESIEKSLLSKGYIRVRVGVTPHNNSGVLQKPVGDKKVSHFVLKPFSTKEQEQFSEVIVSACDIIYTVLKKGAESAMNKYNGRVFLKKHIV